MEENEFHQRQPLLAADPDDLEEHNLSSLSPRVRNGSAIKIEIEMPSCEGLETTKFPKERWKTCCAIIFVIINFIFTTASLSITHELRNPSLPPLPDLALDHLPYHKWALDVSEILIMIATLVAALVVVFHKHRCILIRRICVIVGLLYGYRAITMIVTVLPSANKEYHCDVQLNHTISTGEVAHRVLKIMSGFGLSINGQHVYCGDFIFSGHTMILILCYLIIVEYTPICWLLHWLLWLVAVGGVTMLMVSRGHYTIDVIIAYFVTTRLWFMHNAIIANRHFQQRSSTNHLGRLWWWRLAIWFEENVKGPVPAQFEFPNPWSFSFNSVTTKSRTRDPARDI